MTEEVNRFAWIKDGVRIRQTVHKDESGFYHIDEWRKVDHLVTERKDIHGPMDAVAYINWLANALFNQSYCAARGHREEREWLMSGETDDGNTSKTQ